MSTEDVEIFTDGGCIGNPGPGGWGVLLRYKGVEKELAGFEAETTNNRMEMTAAIKGLEALKRPMKVQLYTDSTYLKDGISKWIFNWKQNNWRTSDKKSVKNQDLWERLDALTQLHHVTWHWVKGHAGHPENERVDQLVQEVIQKERAALD